MGWEFSVYSLVSTYVVNLNIVGKNPFHFMTLVMNIVSLRVAPS